MTVWQSRHLIYSWWLFNIDDINWTFVVPYLLLTNANKTHASHEDRPVASPCGGVGLFYKMWTFFQIRRGLSRAVGMQLLGVRGMLPRKILKSADLLQSGAFQRTFEHNRSPFSPGIPHSTPLFEKKKYMYFGSRITYMYCQTLASDYTDFDINLFKTNVVPLKQC